MARRWEALVRTVDHAAILQRNRNEAVLSPNYAFMVVVASGIATIGLLLNSPAVIIGAMLVSPLMGPIVGAGFALATVDVEVGRRAALALVAGAIAAVGCAAAVVVVSPFDAMTPEILARTRPTLFDLAVAVLSGCAGGYAMVRGRGGAIVGVAIATALMPPLAVVGYGLATLQPPVVRGALLLFVTNMTAIALAVASVALWYGFGRGGLRKRFARQALISVLLLAPLAVPLTVSLQGIVREGRVQATARSVLEAAAARLDQGKLAQFGVRFGGAAAPYVEAIVISAEPPHDLGPRLTDELQRTLGGPVVLNLVQLRADDPRALSHEAALFAARPDPAPFDPVAVLRAEVPGPLVAVHADLQAMTFTLVPQHHAAIGLAAWRDLEASLTRRHPGWDIRLQPPPTGLPPIAFASGSAVLDRADHEQLQLIGWALERWGARAVRLTGHASTAGGGTIALARQRVDRVARWFESRGIAVRSSAVYPVDRQRALERELGEAALRTVGVALAADDAVAAAAPAH